MQVWTMWTILHSLWRIIHPLSIANYATITTIYGHTMSCMDNMDNEFYNFYYYVYSYICPVDILYFLTFKKLLSTLSILWLTY